MGDWSQKIFFAYFALNFHQFAYNLIFVQQNEKKKLPKIAWLLAHCALLIVSMWYNFICVYLQIVMQAKLYAARHMTPGQKRKI